MPLISPPKLRVGRAGEEKEFRLLTMVIIGGWVLVSGFGVEADFSRARQAPSGRLPAARRTREIHGKVPGHQRRQNARPLRLQGEKGSTGWRGGRRSTQVALSRGFKEARAQRKRVSPSFSRPGRDKTSSLVVLSSGREPESFPAS